MTTAAVHGVELYFETTGAGQRLVLTHGSWTDGSGWDPVVRALSERFEVVTWDRRGHSRSRAGNHPGSLGEDAHDLAALIEHLDGPPVHLVGNSYGGSVVLTLLADRPDLVATAAVHEPPLFALLEGTKDARIAEALASVEQRIGSVASLIESGDGRGAAEYFVDNVAFGTGSWGQLPEPVRTVLEANAPTYLDETRDPTALSISPSALAASTAPLLLTHGTESPPLFPAVIAELALLAPAAMVEVLTGAGHVPHTTHPDAWVATLTAFHDGLTTSAHEG